MKPTVSVIMPLYNSSEFMDESIGSVLNQSFPDLELILVDDCSSDDSLSRARSAAGKDRRVRVEALSENVGGGLSRNAGISVASGRYIAFLDSDDIWEKEKLAVQLSQMREKGAVFSYTDYAVFGAEGEKKTRTTPERLNYWGLLRNTAIGCSTVIYDAERIGKRYFPKIRKRQDFGLWLSILRDIDYAYRCGPALTRYRVRHGSVSSNKLVAATYTWKIYREVEGLSLLTSTYCFTSYAVFALLKRW